MEMKNNCVDYCTEGLFYFRDNCKCRVIFSEKINNFNNWNYEKYYV